MVQEHVQGCTENVENPTPRCFARALLHREKRFYSTKAGRGGQLWLLNRAAARLQGDLAGVHGESDSVRTRPPGPHFLFETLGQNNPLALCQGPLLWGGPIRSGPRKLSNHCPWTALGCPLAGLLGVVSRSHGPMRDPLPVCGETGGALVKVSPSTEPSLGPPTCSGGCRWPTEWH